MLKENVSPTKIPYSNRFTYVIISIWMLDISK
jgi:hypothetical protein